jgi:hypothetical protein
MALSPFNEGNWFEVDNYFNLPRHGLNAYARSASPACRIISSSASRADLVQLEAVQGTAADQLTSLLGPHAFASREDPGRSNGGWRANAASRFPAGFALVPPTCSGTVGRL